MLGELGSCIEAVNQRIDDRLGFHLIAHHMRNEQDHQLGAASIGGVVPEQVADHGHVLEQWDAAVSDTATLSDQAAERHREAVARVATTLWIFLRCMVGESMPEEVV